MPDPVAEPEEAFVDPGHGRLRFRVIRGAAPTIVLESGAGEDSSQWASLQPDIFEATGLAVASYDRAGFGQSELPDWPYDATREVGDLRAGLKLLGLGGKVILVGHSYGALLTQLYSSQDPKNISAVVLVDPQTVEFVDSIGGARTLTTDLPEPMPDPAEANRRLMAGFADAIEAFRTAAIPTHVPMVVITAGKPWWPTEERGKAYRAAHENIVRDNPHRSLVVAEGSGHYVTADRPDVVVSAVRGIVARIHS